MTKPKKPKRVVLGEGYPGKTVCRAMYLLPDKRFHEHDAEHRVLLFSFRDLWDKKIRLIAEIIE